VFSKHSCLSSHAPGQLHSQIDPHGEGVPQFSYEERPVYFRKMCWFKIVNSESAGATETLKIVLNGLGARHKS
jgi:hypothetical protein